MFIIKDNKNKVKVPKMHFSMWQLFTEAYQVPGPGSGGGIRSTR